MQFCLTRRVLLVNLWPRKGWRMALSPVVAVAQVSRTCRWWHGAGGVTLMEISWVCASDDFHCEGAENSPLAARRGEKRLVSVRLRTAYNSASCQ